MTTASIASPVQRSAPRERIAWPRLIWVAPLTFAIALGVNFVLRLIVQSLNPRLARMPQLEQPMVTLTIMGCLAAIVVFVLVGLVVKDRPLFWYRVVAIGALLVSWLPDLALAIGGPPAGMAMRVVSPLATFGSPPPGGPGGPGGGPPGGGPPGGGAPGGGPGGPGGGGPPGGFNFTMPVEQVLVLMLLHLATAIVCIVCLSVLMRDRSASVEAAD
jgi:uncharacterized membrane protein YgcG